MKTILTICLLAAFPLVSHAQSPAAPAQETEQHTANTPAHKLNHAWWKKRHEQKLAAAKNAECELLFIGDSITHG
ncbi:MAG: acetylglucosamine-6-sulfatase, partial [Akkermansiaceae bacterium]